MNNQRNKFICPIASYRGQWSPATTVFNANLQEFSQRVSMICGLNANGKLTNEQAYRQIESLWNQLEKSRQELGIVN